MTRTNIITKVVAIALALVTFFGSTAVSVTLTEAATSGSDDTSTIYAQTSENWWYPGSESVTIKQKKAKYSYTKSTICGPQQKTGTIYPTYRITVENRTTGSVKSYTMTNSKKTIKLQRNSSYYITVSYDQTGTWLRANCPCNMKWKTYPYWYATGYKTVIQ